MIRTYGLTHIALPVKDIGRTAAFYEKVFIIQAAGGKIKDKGHFAPGEPYVFFYDPDGYEVEVFFENLPERLKNFN